MVNARENVWFWVSVPESHAIGMVVSDVVVWEVVTEFVHRAVLPCATFATFGVNMKFASEMFTVAACAAVWEKNNSNNPSGTARRMRRMQTPFPSFDGAG
jgi:hypothetical protein